MTAEERLRLMLSLPREHQDFIFKAVVVLCRVYLGGGDTSRPSMAYIVSAVDALWFEKANLITSQVAELASEVTCKLVGATKLRHVAETEEPSETDPLDADDEGEAENEEWPATPSSWHIDKHDPSKDARVGWLIASCTTRKALGHRLEDIRRRNFSRAPQQPNNPTTTRHVRPESHVTSPYRTTQISALVGAQKSATEQPADEDVLGSVMFDVASHPPSQERVMFAADDAAALLGLFRLAESERAPGDDVLILLQLLQANPELWDEFASDKRGRGTGFKWPVDALVTARNSVRPNRFWTPDDVENAKRRLSRFVKRKMRGLGITDRTDFKGLLARLGRAAT